MKLEETDRVGCMGGWSFLLAGSGLILFIPSAVFFASAVNGQWVILILFKNFTFIMCMEMSIKGDQCNGTVGNWESENIEGVYSKVSSCKPMHTAAGFLNRQNNLQMPRGSRGKRQVYWRIMSACEHDSITALPALRVSTGYHVVTMVSWGLRWHIKLRRGHGHGSEKHFIILSSKGTMPFHNLRRIHRIKKVYFNFQKICYPALSIPDRPLVFPQRSEAG